MVWIAIHLSSGASLLVIGAVVLLAWAAVADGPFGVVHAVGLSLHRRGLIAIGLGVGALPVAAGRLTDLPVVIPCGLAAVVLIRTGLFKLTGPAPTLDATLEPPGPGGTALSDGARDTLRRAGLVAGRTGTIVARHADVAVPKGARAAGKLVGRIRPSSRR